MPEEFDYRLIPLNAKISPKDHRDYPITRLVPMLNVFPDEFTIPYNHEVKNQGNIGSCVAHSLSYVLESDEEKKIKSYTQLSPGFVYANRNSSDWQDEGMFPREALKHLQTEGICKQSLFPYNNTFPNVYNLLQSNKDTLMKDASTRKISAYAQLYNVDEIKTALMQLGMVSIEIMVYPSFYQINNQNPVVPIPLQNEQCVGGHEMSIVGWNKQNQWIVLNSWSSNWAKSGCCLMPFEYPLVEAWSVTDLVPQPSPDPTTHKYWRVQCGSFSIKTNGLNEQIRLNNLGLKTYLVQINGQYKIQLGAWQNEFYCRAESKRIKDVLGVDNFVTYY